MDLGNNSALRRPADVFIPNWHLGGNAALDFAVTSGLKTDALHALAQDKLSATRAYEQRKRDFLDTEAHCQEEGLLFIPMVMEAHSGAWGEAARSVWKNLASAMAQVSGEAAATELERGLQGLALTLHRETARSILRRSPPYTPERFAWQP